MGRREEGRRAREVGYWREMGQGSPGLDRLGFSSILKTHLNINSILF
jgi:hypothetical protein